MIIELTMHELDLNTELKLTEVIELEKLLWFIGTQYNHEQKQMLIKGRLYLTFQI